MYSEIKMKLENYRREIDEIDGQILILLNKRAETAKNIGLVKTKAGLPIVDAERETEVLRHISNENRGILPAESVTKIFRRIIRESREIQNKIIEEKSEKGSEICL